MGEAYRELGDHRKAIELFEQTLEIDRRVGIVESVVLGLRVGIALFDVNNVKFAFIVLPNFDVERCTSLRVEGPIRKRPSERLKNFVQLGIYRMEYLWEFRLTLGFPVPNWPFAVETVDGRMDSRQREHSLAIVVHSVFKEAVLR